MENNFYKEVTPFLLIAVITVSLMSFVGGVNEFTAEKSRSSQVAQLVSVIETDADLFTKCFTGGTIVGVCEGADYNRDGVVNIDDFSLLVQATKYDVTGDMRVDFISRPGADINVFLPCFNDGFGTGDCASSDFNDDGVVNLDDFSLVVAALEYDLTGDGVLDFRSGLPSDFALFQECSLVGSGTGSCEMADFNGDSFVNIDDFSLFVDAQKFDLDGDTLIEISESGDDFLIFSACFVNGSALIGSALGDCLSADYNDDGFVNLDDFNIFLTVQRFDLNKNGVVEINEGVNRSDVQVQTPNGGEVLSRKTVNPIKWSGGKGQVQVGVVAANFSPASGNSTVLGWIETNTIPNGTAAWDGVLVCDLLGTTCWTLSSLHPGPYKLIVVSEDGLGNLCFGSSTCNYDVSDGTFTVQKISALTQNQIDSILNLLQSFGANQYTISGVEDILKEEVVDEDGQVFVLTQSQIDSIIHLVHSFGASDEVQTTLREFLESAGVAPPPPGSSPVCGNHVVEVGEACDGPDLKGNSCTLMGFDGGTLICNTSCSGFVTSQCTAGNPPPSPEPNGK